jgi:hypothetical protein
MTCGKGSGAEFTGRNARALHHMPEEAAASEHGDRREGCLKVKLGCCHRGGGCPTHGGRHAGASQRRLEAAEGSKAAGATPTDQRMAAECILTWTWNAEWNSG